MPLRKPPPANLIRGKSLCEDRGRRPNLPILKTLALLRLESSPIMIPDVQPISPTPPRRSGSSLYYDAQSEPLVDQEEEIRPFNTLQPLVDQEEEIRPFNTLQPLVDQEEEIRPFNTLQPLVDQEEEIRPFNTLQPLVDQEEKINPFNTLQDLCLEADEPYPPQSPGAREIRSGPVEYDNEYNRSITQIEFMGYGQPPLSIREGSMNPAEEEKPLMRLKRRASCVGDAMGGLMKNIRRTSGSLRRNMTKALRSRNVQEVTRIGNRKRKEFMAGEETDTETNVTEFGNVVWKRVHHEM